MEHPPRSALIALVIAKVIDWLVNHLKPYQSVVFQRRVRAGCDKELRVLIHVFWIALVAGVPKLRQSTSSRSTARAPAPCFGMSAYDNPPYRPVLEAEGCAK